VRIYRQLAQLFHYQKLTIKIRVINEFSEKGCTSLLINLMRNFPTKFFWSSIVIKMRLHFLFIFFVSALIFAETNSPPSTSTKSRVSRFNEVQNNAISYAYYLRSSYLRNCVTTSLKTEIPNDLSKNKIINSLGFLEKALVYAPNIPFLWQEYAAFNGGVGRVKGVILAYEKLSKLRPTPEIHYKLGRLYNSNANFDKAEVQFKLYLNLRPKDLETKEFVAQMLINAGLKSGKFNNQIKAKSYFLKAVNIFDKLLKDNENAPTYYNKGLAQELLGDSDEALKSYSKAIFIEPDNPDSYLRASRIYYAKGKKAEFLGELKKADEFYCEAANTILLIVPDKKNNPEVLNYAAYLLALMGERLDFAEKLVMRAIENDRENGAFIDTLGWINFKKGNTQNALKNTLEARKVEGDDPVISDHLGDIYFELGQPDKAKEMWNKSLDVEENNINIKSKINALDK